MMINTQKSKMKNKINLVLIIGVMLGLSLGCLGPDGSDSRCEGVVEFDGKKYVGKAKDEKQAELNACNFYCVENDTDFDAMYRIWLDSDKAKSLAEKKGRELTKQESLMEDGKLLDYVTINCANRCVKEANNGKHTLKTSCKK